MFYTDDTTPTFGSSSASDGLIATMLAKASATNLSNTDYSTALSENFEPEVDYSCVSGVLSLQDALIPHSLQMGGILVFAISDSISSGGWSQIVSTPKETSLPQFNAKTELGKRLIALRQRAIDKGLNLLTLDQIRDEILHRRGEVD